MASREEMISFLKAQDPQAEAKQPSREEMIAFLKQNSEPQKSGLRKAGEFLLDNVAKPINDNVLQPIATGLDYTYAPVRQAMAFPAKRFNAKSEDEALQAYADIPGQLLRHPSEAPTTQQVLEMYGVQKEKKISPIAVSNPLGASSYEQNPLEDDPDNTTIYPSAQGAFMVDMLAGGEGINLATKALKGAGKLIGKGAQATQDFAAKKLAPNVNFTPIENANEIKEAASKLGIKDIPNALLTNKS